MDKVYQQLLEIIREEGKYYNDEQLALATVVSISPLQVAYRDMLFTGEDLKVSEHLLEKTVPVTLLDGKGEIPSLEILCKEDIRKYSLNMIKEMKIPSVLKNKDQVVVILRGNILWVFCKVV